MKTESLQWGGKNLCVVTLCTADAFTKVMRSLYKFTDLKGTRALILAFVGELSQRTKRLLIVVCSWTLLAMLAVHVAIAQQISACQNGLYSEASGITWNFTFTSTSITGVRTDGACSVNLAPINGVFSGQLTCNNGAVFAVQLQPNASCASITTSLPWLSWQFVAPAVVAAPAPGIITTVAGGGGVRNGTATSVLLPHPVDVATDNIGNLFIVSNATAAVYKVDSFGNLTVVVGNGLQSGVVNGVQASSTSLNGPIGIAIDAAGNLIIADQGPSVVRRVDASTGIINVIAGSPFNAGFSGDGGPAVSAILNRPGGVAVDGNGNIFIGDAQNVRVRRIDAATGVITTVAGNGVAGFSGDGGPATSASLAFAGQFNPARIAVDRLGNLFIADTQNSRIRRVDAVTHIITTVAGNGSFSSGDGGLATNAGLSFPAGVAVDANGNLFIADSGAARIRKVNAATQVISTIAGSAFNFGFSGDGGPATSATLSFPEGVGVDTAGNVYIDDTNNNRTRKVDANGIITTIAGNGSLGDGGPATSASLYFPNAVTADQTGNLYIADSVNNVVRRVDAVTGVISHIAGVNDNCGFNGDGIQAASAQLCGPDGVVVDGLGNLLIADPFNNRVRRVDAVSGIITTVAGNGTFGFSGDNGPATSANLATPNGVALDGGGNLLIADANNNRIRRVDAVSGVITTVAGNGTAGFSGDNGLATSAALNLASPFGGPVGLAVDAAGNLFFTDVTNGRIRRVDAVTGVITTVAGSSVSCNGGALGDGGAATSASLCFPQGVAVDPKSVLYISDNGFLAGYQRIRRVDPATGFITTIAGGFGGGFRGDGGFATFAGFEFLRGIALMGANHLFVVDSNALRIRRIDFAPGPPATTSSSFTDPTLTQTISGGELILRKELSGFPNYGVADGAADILYTGQAATWHFPVPANTPGASCAHFRVSVIADDHYGVPENEYRLLAWVNGSLDTTPPPALVHGAPAGSRFTNWIAQNYPVSGGSSPFTITLANTSPATSSADFIAVDAVELRIPVSCNVPVGAGTLVSAEFRATAFAGIPIPVASGPEPAATALNPAFGTADVWNQLNVPAFPTLDVNPAFNNLVDSTGAQTSVSFSITGTVLGVSLYAPAGTTPGFVNADALRSDFIAFNSNSNTIPGESTSIQWKITGLAPNTAYDMCIYGSRADVARSFNMTIGGVKQNVPTLRFDDPTPSSCVLFQSILSDANGTISGVGTGIGSSVGFLNEANWSGFQIVAATATAPSAVLNITPPPSVQLNTLESDVSTFFFAERVSFVLPSTIAVDATLPGTYNSGASLTPGNIPAGTVVDSYLLHADPFDPNNGVFYSGSVSFSNPILGVIALSGSLDQTDAILGAPTTLYPLPGSEVARGYELGFPDMFVISADRKTLTFSSAASTADDQLRVVTAASPPQVVAPGTSTTFTSPNVINQTVTIPADANMNGTATMRVSFIQVSPGVFNASIAGGTNGNAFSGGTPVPAGTTCTPIVGAGGNCIIVEDKCFDANGAAFPLCPITAATTPIQLASQYKTVSPQPNPALLIATDGQSNYAVITTGFNPADPTISGGTKGLNSDQVIANLPGVLPADTVPPTTIASTSPVVPNGANGWFTTSPVPVILTATDNTLVSQIGYGATGAQPISPTSVASASTLILIANQGVTTISYQATDQAGNVEQIKAITVKIDTTPPSVAITAPFNGAAYTLNQSVAANYTCSDPESTPAPSCAGPVGKGSNINTGSVGNKVFTVNSTDAAGLSSTQSVSYSVSYKVCILYDPTRAVKSGATIALKLYLCDATGKDVSSLGVIVHATKLIQVSTGANDTIVDSGGANPDNDFRFDSTLGPSGGYIFNLKANLPTGTYNLFFAAGNDPSTTHFLTFQVK